MEKDSNIIHLLAELLIFNQETGRSDYRADTHINTLTPTASHSPLDFWTMGRHRRTRQEPNHTVGEQANSTWKGPSPNTAKNQNKDLLAERQLHYPLCHCVTIPIAVKPFIFLD